MASTNKLCYICLLLYIIHSVHSALIRGSLGTPIESDENEVYVSDYIDVDNLDNIPGNMLTLHQLMDQRELPTLTLVNSERLVILKVGSISLRTVPVFRNVFSMKMIRIDGNKIKTLPRNGFNVPNPSKMQLLNNEIETIENGAFNPGLVALHLRCNKLRRFSHTWFQNPKKLNTLVLDGNKIQHIQQKAFDHMTELRALYLRLNGLTVIDSAAFGPALQNLSLNYNNISQLPASMFSRGYASLENFYVSYNQLTYLSPQLLQSFNLKSISIDGNPWQCPCLRVIEKWIRENDVTRYDLEISEDEPVCVVSLNSSDVCLPQVDSESQQLYASRLSPLYDCYATSCGVCDASYRKYRKIQ